MRFVSIAALTASLTASLLAAACVQSGATPETATASGPRSCFMVDRVNSFSEAGRNTIHVQVSPRAVYELQTLGPCADLDWAHQVGIRAMGSASNLCTGDIATLYANTSGMGQQQCQARVTRRVGDDAES